MRRDWKKCASRRAGMPWGAVGMRCSGGVYEALFHASPEWKRPRERSVAQFSDVDRMRGQGHAIEVHGSEGGVRAQDGAEKAAAQVQAGDIGP